MLTGSLEDNRRRISRVFGIQEDSFVLKCKKTLKITGLKENEEKKET